MTQWAAAVAAGCHCQGLDADGRCAPGFVKAAVRLYHPALACDTDEAAVSAMLGGVSLDVYAACLDPALHHRSASPGPSPAAGSSPTTGVARRALQAATKLGAFARATSARKKRPAPLKRAASPTVLVFANTPPAPRQRKALAPRNEVVAPQARGTKVGGGVRRDARRHSTTEAASHSTLRRGDAGAAALHNGRGADARAGAADAGGLPHAGAALYRKSAAAAGDGRGAREGPAPRRDGGDVRGGGGGAPPPHD